MKKIQLKDEISFMTQWESLSSRSLSHFTGVRMVTDMWHSQTDKMPGQTLNGFPHNRLRDELEHAEIWEQWHYTLLTNVIPVSVSNHLEDFWGYDYLHEHL